MPIGERIRYHRTRRGRTQVAVAGLAGITEAYLSQIERGLKVPSADVLTRIAAELNVPVASLLGEDPAPSTTEASTTTASSVVRALMGRGVPRGTEPATPTALRERVEAVWRIWQESPARFTEAEKLLPSLISDTEHAICAHRTGTDTGGRREVFRTAADLYGLLRSYCRRTGRLDLSLVAADRARRAAEDADDPVRIATAQWNLGHVLLSQGEEQAQEAGAVALLAVEGLQCVPQSPEATAVRGALELVAVLSSARTCRWSEARKRLEQRARPLAEQVGDGNVQWTVFGPTNVELHAMSLGMLAGEASEALRVADQIDTSHLPSRERQFTFGLEVARCYDLRREDAAVLVHLLSLEELAPEDLVRSPLAREMVTNLVRRVRPTYRRQAAALAQRMSLL
ncbi:helix-turn-helix domain-containing protein [Streptomyces carminius]|uniref:helix-turn-helix domain-containing protein n=1 Tax=Streptomyces carminius TaxID=2665496 RepID=UPI001E5860CF|nr:helix-turn-helix transcriptional regulator [Streptomyces carminius]